MKVFRIIWRLVARVVAVATGTLSVLGATVLTDIPFDGWLVVAFVVAAFLAWLDQFLIARSYEHGDRRLTMDGGIVYPSVKGGFVLEVEVQVVNLGKPVILSNEWTARIRKAGAKKDGAPLAPRDVEVQTGDRRDAAIWPIVTNAAATGALVFTLPEKDAEYVGATLTLTGKTMRGQELSAVGPVTLQNPTPKVFVV